METAYRLEETRLGGEWDEFVKRSPNGTIFSLSAYLKSIDQPCKAYYCYKKMEVRGAVALMESDDGQSATLHDFVIYNGLICTPPAHAKIQSTIGKYVSIA